MSETTQQPEADANIAPGLQIMVQYVRDLSFENPGAPNFADMQPEIGVNANVGARKLSDTDYEVGLKFRIEAKKDDKVQFITELEYCGVFRLVNIPEADTKPVLLIEAPRQLFPFARRVLADATRDGGYPPIMLDPIDFMALYQQNQADEDAGDNADSESGETLN
ncbi:MAG: protein-export chaperone SecB [Alphaproteobacteria bacterium]|nr:protein-export chaperone SecB [Alphaproteobacteria bacterium]